MIDTEWRESIKQIKDVGRWVKSSTEGKESAYTEFEEI